MAKKSARGKVKCEQHGSKEESFVCVHLALSLTTRAPVGFHWAEDDDSTHPDAWCDDCHSVREDEAWEWTPRVEKQLDVKLLCGGCYEAVKRLWRRGAHSRRRH